MAFEDGSVFITEETKSRIDMTGPQTSPSIFSLSARRLRHHRKPATISGDSNGWIHYQARKSPTTNASATGINTAASRRFKKLV
jgi:hypothetical protein